jgi:acetyl esterase/lipase
LGGSSWSDEAAEPKTFTYKTAGGCDIKLDAYASDPNTKKPVIVSIHGGALITGTRKDAHWPNPQGESVLISIDYRLAPETKLPAIIEDLKDAFRWVHEKGPELLNIDADKLIVTGGSAGGYLALMSGFCVKPRPKALISISGYGNITGTWYSRPDPFYLQQPRVSKEQAETEIGSKCLSERKPSSAFYLFCRQNGIWPQMVTGHNPDTEPRWFDPYCPVRNVSPDYPPTVLIHGTADTDVPYEESAAMDKELTRNHVPHKFISIPRGGHGLSGTPDERARVFQAAMAFVKEHT